MWVVFICVIFMLPQFSPMTLSSLNYIPVAVVVVLGFPAIWNAASARHWSTDPTIQGSPEEFATIKRELST